CQTLVSAWFHSDFLKTTSTTLERCLRRAARFSWSVLPCDRFDTGTGISFSVPQELLSGPKDSSVAGTLKRPSGVQVAVTYRVSCVQAKESTLLGGDLGWREKPSHWGLSAAPGPGAALLGDCLIAIPPL
ncbi:hypothetical protein H1C71_028485, partial [Ictidomys tridecemlineatus]